MRLRRKTVLVMGTTFIGLVGVVYVTSSKILLGSIRQAEEDSTRQRVEVVLNALDQTKADFSSSVFSWSAWDDTYDFIQNGNQSYIQSNLTPESLAGSQVNLVLYIRSSGRIVFGTGFDLKNQEYQLVPQALSKHFSPKDPLLQHSRPDSRLTGIILLPEGPMLITSQPILPTKASGAIRGSLIFGRYLDAAAFKNLSKIDGGLPLTVHTPNEARLPPDFQAIRDLKETQTLVQPISEQTIAGYTRIKDIYGKPALLLRVDVPRKIYQRGQTSLRYLIISVVVVGLVFGGMTVLLLEQLVLSRLARLSTGVKSIGESSDPSRRVLIQGEDELSSLASNINGMLQSLEHSQDQLRQSQEKYRSVVDNVKEVIFQTDVHGLWTFLNPAWTEITGFSLDESIGRSCLDFVHERDRQRYQELFEAFITQRGDEFGVQGAESAVETNSALRTPERQLHASSLNVGDSPSGNALLRLRLTQSPTEGNPPSGLSHRTRLAPQDGKPEFRTPHSALLPPRPDYFRREISYLTKQGGSRWMEIYARLTLATNGIVGISGTLNDITDRKAAEEALRQTEEKYRNIFENAVEGIFQTTDDGRYISANPALARIYGYESAEELVASLTNVWQQLYVAPNRRADFISLMQQNDAVSGFESQVRRKDGKIIWIAENARAVKDISGGLLYYEGSVEDITIRKVTQEALRYQQQQSEELLRNILPGPIAERLKLEPQNTIADSFAEVTVLFADIVNFTQISSHTPPTELVGVLNSIFSTFDNLADHHGLEKIKTIGDAYMVVGGLPLPQLDHAEAIAEMALDMQKAIARFETNKGEPFSIRIGINTGAVVAGVIGLKKFIYDLWGDTVNTASRMESHGLANRIQVTEATYIKLRDQYLFEKRGAIQIKGKGEMTTYLLTGRREVHLH